MNDSYQAIYDAVRSRISGGNVSDAIRDVLRDSFDISHLRAIVQQDFCAVANEMQRPSVLFKPELSVDGNMFCALYGTDLQSGLAGFGETAELAMRNFDKNWFAQKLPVEARSKAGA